MIGRAPGLSGDISRSDGPLPSQSRPWGVKQAVIEPIAMTSLMQVFFNVTEGQVPNAEWEARLDGVSGKFRKLKEKADTWGTERPLESLTPQRAA